MKKQTFLGRSALRRALALLMCLLLCLGAAACAQEDESSQDIQSTSHELSPEGVSGTATGKYVETETASFDDGYFWDLMQTKDTLYLYGSHGCQASQDGGRSWEDFERGSPLAEEMEAEGYEMGCPYFSWDGRRLQALSKNMEHGGLTYAQYRYILHETDGSEREVEIRLPAEEVLPVGLREEQEVPEDSFGTYLLNPILLADNTLVGLGFSSTVYHIDLETGEILHTIAPENDTNESRFSGMAVTPTSLLILSQLDAQLYDLETWKRRKDDQVIDEFISRGKEMADGGYIMSDNTAPRYIEVYGDGQEEAYYICDSTGIYRYMPGGVTIEQLLPAERTTMSLSHCYLQSFVKGPDDYSFFALFSTGAFQADQAPPYSIFDYSYDSDAVRAPEQDLKIYALAENEYLQQAVALFQRKHPELNVILEAGINPSVSWEISDALRILNTEIMAGKGPDVLILDMMSVENYQNKGLLADITDTADEIKAQGDILDNVTDIYKTDGKIYAMPASFDMPIVVGAPEHLEKITGFEALADTIVQLRRENPEISSISGYRDTGYLSGITQSMIMPRCIREDRTVDWDTVKIFYQQVARMNQADADTKTDSGITGDGSEENPTILDTPIYVTTIPGMSIRTGYSVLELRSLNTLDALPCLYTSMEEAGLQYKTLEDSGVRAFTPAYILGISAKSQQQNQAKAFIQFMFSEEMQNPQGFAAYDFNLPVNADAIRRRFAGKEGKEQIMYVDIGDEHQLSTRNPQAEEIEDFIARARQLDTALATQDMAIQNALFAGCYQYQSGIKTLDEAIAAAREEIELYLAEA